MRNQDGKENWGLSLEGDPCVRPLSVMLADMYQLPEVLSVDSPHLILTCV